MAQFHKTARVIGGNNAATARFEFVRRAVYLMALVTSLWSAETSAQAVPANCPSNLATADIINHDFTVSFCEL